MRDRQKRDLARTFRREPTLAEAALWELVRGRRLNGWKFRRQAPILQFVADFACLDPKLVVELDGVAHEFQQARDAARDALIEAQGFTIIRINERVVRERPHDAEAWITFVGARVLAGLSPYPDEPGEPPP